MPGISALSTAEAVRIARGSAERGAEALMVLPPYVHSGKMHETVRPPRQALREADRREALALIRERLATRVPSQA